jgi:hypothetical protein
MLPLRSLQKAALHPRLKLGHQPPGPLSFFETDHGDGRPPSQGGAIAWLDELLHSQGIVDATGEVWLHTYPRVLGFTFKPVSFWYCHRAPDDQGGALRAIVVEVNNTFGERHCYLLDTPQIRRGAAGQPRCFTCRRFARCRATTAFVSCAANRAPGSARWRVLTIATTTHRLSHHQQGATCCKPASAARWSP